MTFLRPFYSYIECILPRPVPKTKEKSLKPLRNNDLRLWFADWTGLEPATSAVTGRHSNRLNYQSMPFVQKRGKDRVPVFRPPNYFGKKFKKNSHPLFLYQVDAEKHTFAARINRIMRKHHSPRNHLTLFVTNSTTAHGYDFHGF